MNNLCSVLLFPSTVDQNSNVCDLSNLLTAVSSITHTAKCSSPPPTQVLRTVHLLLIEHMIGGWWGVHQPEIINLFLNETSAAF